MIIYYITYFENFRNKIIFFGEIKIKEVKIYIRHTRVNTFVENLLNTLHYDLYIIIDGKF